MSLQLHLAATVSSMTMALFALAHTPVPDMPGIRGEIAVPYPVTAAYPVTPGR